VINLERKSLGSRIGFGSVMESVPVMRKTMRGRPTGGTKPSAAQGRERRARQQLWAGPRGRKEERLIQRPKTEKGKKAGSWTAQAE
jgi:hypothetical protein